MENTPIRPRRRPRKAAKQSLWTGIKQRPLIYHAILICGVLAAIIIFSSILMNVITRHGTHRTVPDFMGVKIAEAEQMAKKSKLEIIINDSLFVPAYEGGIVLDQLPKGGVQVKAGRKIYVTINSFRQKMVAVPYVAGRSLRQAKNMLEVAGLEIEKLIYEEDIATNYVLGEYVGHEQVTDESKVEIEMGSGVILKVGVQPEKNSTIVPKAIGQSLQAAKSRLWEQGLNIGKINFDEGINLLNQKDARVYRQSLSHNSTAKLGSAVDLWLTLDDKLVEKNSTASDKAARELEEERLKAEEALRDSLEQADKAAREELLNALEQTQQQSTEIVESEEDEFFQ
ncbi:MAG: PASTA domain-containing protein [Alistipes sp.]|nr:PASTA domain-containing protein [Alistipes sp.]